jgi:competence protein ComEA
VAEAASRRLYLSARRKSGSDILRTMLRESSSWWGVVLTAAALLCGGWALWPVAFPSPLVPVVSHTELPLLQSVAAPEYPKTASISPLISGRLNLNAATEEQLESLPKIGPALAARLIAARPYHNLQDLDAVKGVGPSLMKTLTPLVTF